MGRQGTCQRVCDTDAHHLVSESRFGLAVPGDSCRDCVVKALLGAAVGFPDAIIQPTAQQAKTSMTTYDATLARLLRA